MSGAGCSGQPDKAVVVWERHARCFEEMPRREHLFFATVCENVSTAPNRLGGPCPQPMAPPDRTRAKKDFTAADHPSVGASHDPRTRQDVRP
jgi:hypothetical protein